MRILHVDNLNRFKIANEHLFGFQKEIGVIGLPERSHKYFHVLLSCSHNLVQVFEMMNSEHRVLAEKLPLSQVKKPHSC